MATHDSIFVADPEGWRSQNIDRPPAHLVRELVQNSLDESGVSQLDVTVTFHGPRQGTTVRVVDNAPQGVKDANLLFTIFMSDKEDSHLKRGRMGRGLKEIMSVSNQTTIRSMSIDAMRIERFQGGRWERKSLPKLGRTLVGTEVTCFCRAWGESAAKAIVGFVKRVRAPKDVTITVTFINLKTNDKTDPVTPETVVPFPASETYDMWLPTVIYEVDEGDRKARERTKTTKVECFAPPPGEKAYIYELGIPVESCESSPVSMDVQQRVILRERRDTVTDSYRRQLLAQVLDARVKAGIVGDAELKSNMALMAAEAPYHLSTETKKKLADAWTSGLAFSDGTKEYQHATGHHIPVVRLRDLPESMRDIVKGSGTSVAAVIAARKNEFCPELSGDSLLPEHKRLITFFEWTAAGAGRKCTVKVCAGKPDAGADFDRSCSVMRIYKDMVGAAFFKDPAGAEPLSTLIHELAHWEQPASGHEHGLEFSSNADDVGGAVARFLMLNANQAWAFLNGETAVLE